MAYRDEKGKPYSADYLRTIHAQLTAIFNHAVNFYNLPYNPARRAGTIGSEAVKEMDFWTKEEYLKFSEAMMDKPRSYYAFEMLYWCGMRSGELLALTPADIDFEKQTVTISKTFHRSKGRDIITSPKTKKSNRTIKMPTFLCEEMQEYIKIGVECADKLFFATQAKTLNEGLDGELEGFLKEHKDARLIIIDTLQKVREVGGDRYSYSSDYEIVTKLKSFSDKYGVCLLVIHHTRKLESEDSFDMISGTDGLLGAADGAFIMHKKKRTDNTAVMDIVGRDQPDQELTIEFDREQCIWKFQKAETELWKQPPNPLLEAINEFLTEEVQEWEGTATELLKQLPDMQLSANVLSRRLNVVNSQLLNDYGIFYDNKRGHERKIILKRLEQKV